MNAIIRIILIFPLAAIRAGTACRLWSWFVAGWLNVATPSLWQGAGILLLVGFATTSVKYEKAEEESIEQICVSFIFQIALCGLILLYGWAFKELI